MTRARYDKAGVQGSAVLPVQRRPAGIGHKPDIGEPARVQRAHDLHHLRVRHGTVRTQKDPVALTLGGDAAQARDKPSMAGWFVGQVMKATGGKANPKAVNEIVTAKLGL